MAEWLLGHFASQFRIVIGQTWLIRVNRAELMIEHSQIGFALQDAAARLTFERQPRMKRLVFPLLLLMLFFGVRSFGQEQQPNKQNTTQPAQIPQGMNVNSEAAKASPAAAAAAADVGHIQTPAELAELVGKGEASRCAVITSPAGAQIEIDGNRAGISPVAFVLLRHGNTPRVVTIRMSGYKTVEKQVIPDGKSIPIGLTLEAESNQHQPSTSAGSNPKPLPQKTSVTSSLGAQPTSTWLEPSDALIQQAISDGFASRKLSKDARWHSSWTSITGAGGYSYDSRIELYPPLYCAMQAGVLAHDKLESMPDLETVKGLCLHRMHVLIVHYSVALGEHFPCVFEKGDMRIKPTFQTPDANPEVTHFYMDFLRNDVVGYRYYDSYSFDLPPTMIDTASFTYADDRGKHHTFNFNFSVFAKDANR